MKSDNFFISYPLQNINSKNVITTPFKINIRTNDGLIEKKCAELFPDLMVASQYTQEQLFKLQQMKAIIKKAFNKNDIESVHKLFYDGRYLYPLPFPNKLSAITLTSYDCKMWTNNEPRLELEGYVTLDLNELFKYYYENKLIKVIHNKKLIRQEISLVFAKPLPLLFVYERASDCQNKILANIIKMCQDANSFLFKDLMRITKNERLKDLTKDISWQNNYTIKIAMNDLSQNIINKLKDNSGKIAFGYLLYQALKKK